MASQTRDPPVPVLREKVPLYSLHQVFEAQVHGLLLLWRLAVDDAVPQVSEILQAHKRVRKRARVGRRA